MVREATDPEKCFAAAVDSQRDQQTIPLELSEDEKVLERKTVRRLDLLLVPMMCGIYLLAFLDRANIGNARVAGLQKELGLTDHQYQTAITVTYVPYIIAELPSNLVLKKIGPRIMLPGMCFCWGIVSTLQSLVNSYSGLLACRAFLGLCEGGLFPGIVLYLSGFYKPHELQLRIAMFFSAAALSGAFSGLLAAAIGKMNNISGLHGWQWIFLLEGLFTVLFAAFAAWVLPNTPQQVRTFNSEQIAWCEKRLAQHDDTAKPGGGESEKITLPTVLSTFTSPHIWILCLILFFNGSSLFGLAYFTPSIVSDLGYSPTQTQLMTVPPFACAFLITMVAAYVSDRHRLRGLTAICTTCLAIIGFSLFLSSTSTEHARKYVALFFMVTGTYATAPSLISWIPNNVAGHARRATAVAMGFVATNIGGIVSTWIYPKSQAPGYGFATRWNLGMSCGTVGLVAVEVALLWWVNRRKERGEMDHLLVRDGVDGLEGWEQQDVLGDRHPDFRYTL